MSVYNLDAFKVSLTECLSYNSVQSVNEDNM